RSKKPADLRRKPNKVCAAGCGAAATAIRESTVNVTLTPLRVFSPIVPRARIRFTAQRRTSTRSGEPHAAAHRVRVTRNRRECPSHRTRLWAVGGEPRAYSQVVPEPDAAG